MHSIICFSSFLFLVDLICFIWFYSIGYFETSIGIIAVSVIAFLVYLFNCNSLQDDTLSTKEKNKKYFLSSIITLFIALFLINIFYYITASNAGGGALIVMVAVIPVTIFMLILYLLYSALYFGILKIAKYLEKL